MHRSRVITFAIGGVLAAGAAIAQGITWWGGSELQSVPIESVGEVWVGVMPAVRVPASTPVVLDLVTDYTYTGDVAVELDGTVTMAHGRVARLVAIDEDDEGGAVVARHARSDVLVVPEESDCAVELVLRTRGDVQISSATATLRASPIDLGWLVMLLGFPAGIALTLGLLAQRIESRNASDEAS